MIDKFENWGFEKAVLGKFMFVWVLRRELKIKKKNENKRIGELVC